MTVPHDYSPDGPVQAAPYEGYCRPRTKQEPFAAPLQGVHMGAYDECIIAWLMSWDDPACRTIASLMHPCRLAGREEGRQ